MEDNNKYQSFPLLKIKPDTELPADLFLYLSGHFVKYKVAGDSLPMAKYNLFVFKKMTHLFVLVEDIEKYESWANQEERKEDIDLAAKVGEKHKELVSLRRELKGEIFQLFTDEISDETVIKCMETTRTIIDKVQNDASAQSALTKLIDYSESVADHSMSVAYLSVHFAQQLGYTHQIALENIYMGGLLHDFGKTRIDPKYFEDESSENYDKAMMAHPELGKTTLMARTELSEEVLRIVAEHHERHDGRGYPKGMKGGKIYDLAKIVSIANSFFDFVSAADGDFAEKKKKAIYLIENDNGHMFDPKKTEICVAALKALP